MDLAQDIFVVLSQSRCYALAQASQKIIFSYEFEVPEPHPSFTINSEVGSIHAVVGNVLLPDSASIAHQCIWICKNVGRLLTLRASLETAAYIVTPNGFLRIRALPSLYMALATLYFHPDREMQIQEGQNALTDILAHSILGMLIQLEQENVRESKALAFDVAKLHDRLPTDRFVPLETTVAGDWSSMIQASFHVPIFDTVKWEQGWMQTLLDNEEDMQSQAAKPEFERTLSISTISGGDHHPRVSLNVRELPEEMWDSLTTFTKVMQGLNRESSFVSYDGVSPVRALMGSRISTQVTDIKAPLYFHIHPEERLYKTAKALHFYGTEHSFYDLALMVRDASTKALYNISVVGGTWSVEGVQVKPSAASAYLLSASVFEDPQRALMSLMLYFQTAQELYNRYMRAGMPVEDAAYCIRTLDWRKLNTMMRARIESRSAEWLRPLAWVQHPFWQSLDTDKLAVEIGLVFPLPDSHPFLHSEPIPLFEIVARKADRPHFTRFVE